MSIRCESIDINLNKREILKNISVEVNEKEILSIIGPNGAGKSTLLKSLAEDIIQLKEIFFMMKKISIILIFNKELLQQALCLNFSL